MEFIALVRMASPFDGYAYKDASNIEMNILGDFLVSDVRCGGSESYKEWGLTDKWKNDETNGNITALERSGNYILLRDLFSEEEVPAALKMTREQFGQILTVWEEKVCKLKPKEVIIKYENDQFIIETTE
jgi:hypothetical protein